VASWTANTVADADERESHFSPTANRIETSEFLLFVVPESYALTYVRRFQCAPERADTAIDEVLVRVRELGGTGLRWVVNSKSSPGDLSTRLLRRGFVKLTEAETLFFELGAKGTPRLPRGRTARGVSARAVYRDEEIDLFVRLGERIFGDPVPPPAYLEKFRSEVHRTIDSTGHSELFLSYDGGVPVGRGGMSMTGVVGRLWTAGVVRESRGKGAYMALVTERCKAAHDQGAEIALTHAKVGTSGPILKAHGFLSAGPYTYYELASVTAPRR
jgi:hypothetical protein